MSTIGRLRWAVAAALITTVAACGADESEVGVGTSGSISDATGGDDALTAYCEYITSLDERLGFPTDDEWDRLAELAPNEIADDAAVIVEWAKRVGEAYEIDYGEEGGPDPSGAASRIEAFSESNCGVSFLDVEVPPEADPEDE